MKQNEDLLLNDNSYKTDVSALPLKEFSSKKIEADFFSNIAKISEYMQEIDEANLEDKKVFAKSVRFTGYEMILLEGFLKNNQITIANLVKFFFFQAGAFDDFAIYVMEKKGMNIDFTRYDPNKWDLDSHKMIDISAGHSDEKKLAHSDLLPESVINSLYTIHKKESETPSMNFHKFQSDLMSKFIEEHKEEYNHFNRFVKMMLLHFKIFPQQLSQILAKNMKTKSTKNKDTVGSERRGHLLTLTTHPFERIYIDNLAEFAKTIDPSLSLPKIIKHKLHELGYISDMERYPIERAQNGLNRLKGEFDPFVDYVEQEKFMKKDYDEYVREYQAMKGGSGNLAISFSNEDAKALMKVFNEEIDPSTKELYGTITRFVREKVFKNYNIYPFPEILEIIENPPHKKRGRKKKV